MAENNLTNTQVFVRTLDRTISMYLKEGESAEYFLEEYRDDKIALVKFLRNREYVAKYSNKPKADVHPVKPEIVPKIKEKEVVQAKKEVIAKTVKGEKKEKAVSVKDNVASIKVKTAKKAENKPKEGDLGSLFD